MRENNDGIRNHDGEQQYPALWLNQAVAPYPHARTQRQSRRNARRSRYGKGAGDDVHATASFLTCVTIVCGIRPHLPVRGSLDSTAGSTIEAILSGEVPAEVGCHLSSLSR
jgi:hypothetical protein